MRHHSIRMIAFLVALAITIPTIQAQEEYGWPEVFNPFVLRTLNLTIDSTDWNTIRKDTTNEIEVPAQFWADNEAPILVSVRRKSSRALPSEGNPIKVGLKIDINEFDKQEWHGLVKLSLENGGDLPALEEGFAWNLHELASVDGFYGNGYHAGLANWVRVNVNGQYIGVYTSVEQRDKRLLENRGLWQKDFTWLYEVDDIGSAVLEEGDPHSPTFTALCYSPFAGGRKAGGCSVPNDTTLGSQLDSLIEMNAMLTQGAVDAFTDNDDALFSHGKNFSFADFDHDGLKRRYYPWDLDAVFRQTDASIYGEVGRRGRVTQSPYQSVILNHANFRARYNAIMLGLTEPASSLTPGPLSETALHQFLDDALAAVEQAVAEDPYSSESAAATVARLKNWVSARIADVRVQAVAAPSGPPPTR